ncbi:MAG: cation:proton antiporter [Bacteroidales bacterium]|nr:cation:proton antiporter [Bacteroidales bacterium]
MAENLKLVADLALILISAGVVTIVFKLLKQPLVLGYIVAGFLVGPYLHIFPTVTDISEVEVWSEIGIIFLLFGLGLEFSFKKLFSVGSKAFVTAFVGIVVMVAVGLLLGIIIGWDPLPSAFLGGMLAMSSTTIIIKAFEDMKLKNEPFVDLTMVVLIIQDIVAVVMMVLMSTAAARHNAGAGKEMLMSIVKLVFFLILWFVVGIYVIPTFFRKAKKYINDETLLIISIGLCFGMVMFANSVGFSSALGAFVIGSILSETIESERIIELTKGIKDLFGAIFFVSVGMMIDPHVLVDNWQLILTLVLVTLILKPVASAVAAVIAGASFEDSLKTGFTLAQIGEFAFIVASVGVAQGLMPQYIYPVVIASSVITTFTTPYWIKLATPLSYLMVQKMSPNLKTRIDKYSLFGKTGQKKSWKQVISDSIVRVLVYSVISFAVLMLLFEYAIPFLEKMTVHDVVLSQLLPTWAFKSLCAIGSLLIILPFLFGLLYNSQKTRDLYADVTRENNGNILVVTIWTCARFLIAGLFVFAILVKFFHYTKWVIVLVTIAIVLFMMFSNRTLHRFRFIESKFMANLNAKESDSESVEIKE